MHCAVVAPQLWWEGNVRQPEDGMLDERFLLTGGNVLPSLDVASQQDLPALLQEPQSQGEDGMEVPYTPHSE